VKEPDAIAVGKSAKMPLAPVMIYGDDVTHLVTEEGIAYLCMASSLEQRRDVVASVAKATPIGSPHHF
jgi:malonate decarboxylase alpha subunit